MYTDHAPIMQPVLSSRSYRDEKLHNIKRLANELVLKTAVVRMQMVCISTTGVAPKEVHELLGEVMALRDLLRTLE